MNKKQIIDDMYNRITLDDMDTIQWCINECNENEFNKYVHTYTLHYLNECTDGAYIDEIANLLGTRILEG